MKTFVMAYDVKDVRIDSANCEFTASVVFEWEDGILHLNVPVGHAHRIAETMCARYLKGRGYEVTFPIPEDCHAKA